MKNLLIMGCLIGAVCVVTADAAPTSVQASVPYAVTTESQSDQNTTLAYSPISLTATQAVQQAEKAREFQLLTVNEVSLYDERDSVIHKLGEPLRIESDEYLPEVAMLHYDDMTIYCSGDFIDFIEIPGTAKDFVVDGVRLQVNEEEIRAAFGEPDYVTEDGIVFERNSFMLKLFLDEHTKQLTSITYFYEVTV